MTRYRSARRSRAALVAALAASLTLGAAGTPAAPRVWVQEGTEDFGAGDANGVTITADGSVRIARPLTVAYDADDARVWDIAADGSGGAFAAPGDEGAVWHLRPGAAPRRLAELGEPIQALVADPAGAVVAAAGALHRVAADGSGSRPWVDLEVEYVWDLLWVGADLYAATGEDGGIRKVSRDGTVTTVYDALASHVTALASGAGGSVLAGTSAPGRVLRLSPDGSAFVLYETPLEEVTGIAVAGEVVWVGAFGALPGGANGAPSPRPSESGGGRGALYRFEAGAFPETVWSSESEGIHALTVVDGMALAGTGPRGRLLQIDRDGGVSVVVDLADEQIVGLAGPTAGWLASSNRGRVFDLEDGLRPEGELLSAAHDTRSISRWGGLRWRGDTDGDSAIEFTTRSGNSSTPDATWSRWQELDGDAKVASPPARYVQWRARLVRGAAGASPLLRSVEVAFVPGNLAPTLERIRVHPAGVVYRQPASLDEGLPFAQLPPSVVAELEQANGGTSSAVSSFMGRALYVAGLRTITWQGSDPNGDELLYALAYRASDESRWKTLARELTATTYLLETDRFADGRYRVRVTASDGPSHAQDAARSTHATSAAFTVDNSAPRLEDLRATSSATGVRLQGRAWDETSFLGQLRYSVDGARWRTVVPVDGATDSAAEEFDLTIDGLGPGEHTIVVQAIDTMLNRGAGRLVVDIR